ncbi:universal stress protein [Paractinoplanes ferrugineus]|uniref:Universal stress protein n=1 Tax=Paractinoplanes ferrugineus TaxID=113564 RepID=A0A919MM71_9ACTN|nr:universal stress protein [Actinoplanes ferrugineus]GIE12947.1 universal stress protein [Actinoplanes ferrugineus]
MRVNPVIVGADGTDCSKTAVRWAAREARRLGLPLRVTHAFDWEWREARDGVGYDDVDNARKIADGITANAVYEAHVVAGDLEVEGDAVVGNPAPRLLADSEAARLVVLGSRGRGGFGGLLLGSVSQRVATHAKCSVVVVRGRGESAAGPVVAGVDDSPVAETVLESAFEAAAGRGSGLEVVRGFASPLPLWMAGMAAVDLSTPPMAELDEYRELEEQLAPWRDKFPDVPVRLLVTEQNIASVLVAASAKAQLVVVGSRGHGVVAGTLLGSTGLQLLHHADCPVYIVRRAER